MTMIDAYRRTDTYRHAARHAASLTAHNLRIEMLAMQDTEDGLNRVCLSHTADNESQLLREIIVDSSVCVFCAQTRDDNDTKMAEHTLKIQDTTTEKDLT